MIRSKLFAALSLAIAATLAQAGPVTPTFTAFGNLAGATFGGSGIPTDPAAITTAGGVTVALIATQRYSNPVLGNDGAGTYFATSGLNDGLDGGGHSVAATWNFGFYVNVGTATLSSYQIDLFYDLDAGVGTDLAAMGRIDIDASAVANGVGGQPLTQGSQNLNFGFLATGVPGFVFAPGGAFNANANGEYSFMLRVRDLAGNDVATSAINVVVGVPEPGSLALAGLALAGLVAAGRKRRV